MNGSEAHEARMRAVLRLTAAKDRFSRLSCDYLVGRDLSAEEVQAALQGVEDARAELAALDATA
jgi:hypothetical protein